MLSSESGINYVSSFYETLSFSKIALLSHELYSRELSVRAFYITKN
jgi:hypothetical protein